MDPSSQEGKGEIETFIIDWPVLALIGLVFGSFATRPWWRSRAFMAASVVAGVFTAVALISYTIAPDWMWMYFLDPSDVSWSVPVIAVGYLVVYVFGFAAAVALRELGPAATWTAAGVAVAMEAAVLALTWDRYHLIGTAREWLSGDAHELLSASPTGPARSIGLMGPGFLLVAAIAFVLVVRGRRAPTSDR